MMNAELLTAPESLRRLVLDLRQMETFIEDPLVVQKADGVWYEDVNGRRILDGLSGIFTVNAGHGNRRIIEAIKAQLDTMAFAPPLHATSPPAIELVQRLAEVTPEDLNTIKLLSGGSEATEAAMKLARQYHRQTGNPGKFKVISRFHGYHGATMGALSATGTRRRKTMFEPTLHGFLHVHPPTCYRCPYEKTFPDCEVFCARTVEDLIELEGAETIAALILEPVGNTGGIIMPPPGYLPELRDICNRHEILLIYDEIITGFGRTGSMFAAQTFEAAPDILCMGKGMSSGYVPLAGIAFRDSIADRLSRSRRGRSRVLPRPHLRRQPTGRGGRDWPTWRRSGKGTCAPVHGRQAPMYGNGWRNCGNSASWAISGAAVCWPVLNSWKIPRPARPSIQW